MTPEQLKISILKAAINGKLTYHEESSDSDLPVGWSICKMGKIADIVVGATPSTSNASYWENGDIPWIPSGSCQNCDVSSAPKFITKDGYNSCSTKLMPPDTVLIALTGATAGKVGYLTIEACGNQSVVGILPSEKMNQRYIYYYLMGQRDTILADCVGSAQPHISKAYVVEMDINVPPLEEQHRIVAKIEELLPYVDRYAEAYEKLEQFNAKFPEDMKKSILQYAIQGKLVEQRPEEGTAEDLLKSLNIDEKVIANEEPFDIPETWRWVPIGNLGASTDTDSFADGPFGSNLKTIHYINEPEVRIIQLSNIGEDGWKDKNTKYTSYKHLEEVIPRCEVQPGDLVIAKMMPAGRTIEVPNLGTRITLGSDAMKFVPNPIINKQYLLLAMRSPVFLDQVYAEAHGITRVRTTLKGIKSYVIPIPPLAEQQRIVDKVNQMLSLCNKL